MRHNVVLFNKVPRFIRKNKIFLKHMTVIFERLWTTRFGASAPSSDACALAQT